MGFFDDMKYRREASRKYREAVALVKSDIARHEAAENQARLKLDKLIEVRNGGFDDSYFRGWNTGYLDKLQSDPVALDAAIDGARQDYIKWQQIRQKAEKELVFMRPNKQADIAERKAAFVNFAQKVLAVDPEGELALRFHSTTLAATKDIIESGGLISSVDRLDGFLETTNYSNEISVSEIQNIQYSINYWTDIEGYHGCRPCGCMFVVQPRTQEEANMIAGRQMHNVLFHEHPEQLIAIVTTSENVEKVKGWLREVGLFVDDVYRFDEFAAALENIKDSLVPEYKKVQEKEIVCDSLVSSVEVVISDAEEKSFCSGVGEDRYLASRQQFRGNEQFLSF